MSMLSFHNLIMSCHHITFHVISLSPLVGIILTALENNLNHRAKSYKLDSLNAIFLLNNFHYIAKQLRYDVCCVCVCVCVCVCCVDHNDHVFMWIVGCLENPSLILNDSTWILQSCHVMSCHVSAVILCHDVPYLSLSCHVMLSLVSYHVRV